MHLESVGDIPNGTRTPLEKLHNCLSAGNALRLPMNAPILGNDLGATPQDGREFCPTRFWLVRHTFCGMIQWF